MNPPFHIPFAVKIGPHEKVISLKAAEETFSFGGLKEKPVPSLLRGFSAPVILKYPYTEAELLHLMAHDDDLFNRWEAGQRLAASAILESRGMPRAGFVAAARDLLADPDPAFAAEALNLPSETFLAEQLELVDPDALHEVRNRLRARARPGAAKRICSPPTEAEGRSPLFARPGIDRPARAAQPVPFLSRRDRRTRSSPTSSSGPRAT